IDRGAFQPVATLPAASQKRSNPMSLTQTPAGWTFTHGTQTYGPYPTREAAQEALYDAERGHIPPVPPPALLSLDAQIAQIGPCADRFDQRAIDIGTLPGGETLTRGIGDGVPNDWITIARGKAEIDVRAGGAIVGITIGGRYLDEVTTDDLDDLRALLCLD